MRIRSRTILLLALLAVGVSLVRFGQRENPQAALSDSDYYLDMALVLSGEKPQFDPAWSAPGDGGAHHYTRPLLPFLAGAVARALPGVGLASAFSLVGLLGAWGLAVGLYAVLAAAAPTLRHPWLPSALFLTGFPQVNWGYHLLTDTLGYATAFGAAVAAWALLRWQRAEHPGPTRLLPALFGLFVLQCLAFLTRETGWMVLIVTVWLIARGAPRPEWKFGALVLAVLLLATLPWLAYVELMNLRTIAIPLDPAAWLEPGYLLDVTVKSGVAFHFAWLLALVGLRAGGLRDAPDLLLGWTVAALGYMAAGYAHNSLGGIGYPLRLTYALFPLVYFLGARGLESSEGRRATLGAALALVALNAVVGVGGTLLDRGASGVTVPGLIRSGLPAPP